MDYLPNRTGTRLSTRHTEPSISLGEMGQMGGKVRTAAQCCCTCLSNHVYQAFSSSRALLGYGNKTFPYPQTFLYPLDAFHQ
jgi:hypothetical protein